MSTNTFTFRQGDLPKLDIQVDRGTDFMAWKAQWDCYSSLSGLNEQSDEKQVQALTLCFSRETLTIVQNLGLSEDDRKKVSPIITALKKYVDGHINETVERRNFRRRFQQPGESFDDYLVSLRELVKTCNFCSEACSQKSIRDQIIEGLVDGEIIEDLLQQSDLTLATTITKCRAKEAAKQQRAEITDKSQSISALHRSATSRQTIVAASSCQGCGGKPHPGGRTQCPAYTLTCFHCQRVGHLAKVCRSKSLRKNVPRLTDSEVSQHPQNPQGIRTITCTDTDAQPPLPHIHHVTANETAPTIHVHVTSPHGSSEIEMLPDSGADVSAAGKEILAYLGEHIDNLPQSEITPRAVNGSVMQPLGKLPVTLRLGDKQYRDDIHINPGVSGALMSWRASKGLGILPDHYPHPLPTTNVPSQSVIKATTVNPTTQPLRITNFSIEFPRVFDGLIRNMRGEEFHITLATDAKPFCVNTPRSIPFAFRDKLKAELDLLQEQNIIAPVTEVTEWCAPIVVTPKKNSESIRMCVDLSHLNRFVQRERYQSLTPAQAVADIVANDAKCFTVLDAMKGYHQCALDKESQLLTTFITPFGRFKYLRAPYGICSISEHYDRRMAEAFAGLTGFRRIVDDIVIYDGDAATHADHVRQFLKRCEEHNIALNLSKCNFCQTRVTFAGFILSAEGYQVDHSITNAISQFPTPTNRTDLRSFFGLANQLSACTNSITPLLSPLRPLLSTKNDFVWSPHHEKAFLAAKDTLTVAPVVSFFDPGKLTRLCTDASRQGLGFLLQQKGTDGPWTLVQAGSRFLTETESHYAVIELELLAISWAVSKCRLFLAGIQHFTIITDHNPLISILNHHRLDEVENPRLQRLKTRLMAYNFTAEWRKGSQNDAPDALSRNPVSDPLPQDMHAEYDVTNQPEMSIQEIRTISNDGQESPHVKDLRAHAEKDEEYQQLRNTITSGFPEHRGQLPELCKRYWHVRQHLTLDNNLIVHGCRLLIPTNMRKQVLTQLHESHQGMVRTKQRARLTVYWPGIDNDIDSAVLGCRQCQEHLPSNHKEPLIHKNTPSRPFQEVAADFCSHAGQNYLILVDCYTDWPSTIPMGSNTTAPRLVAAVRQSFCRTGIPDIFWTDEGPQFTSKVFHDFVTRWRFEHKTSTPRYPQSNGKIEATVKSMKKIIRGSWTGRLLDDDKLCRALLQYRNTPSRKDGASPAQKLYGHPIQDALPAHRRSFSAEWQHKTADIEQQAAKTLETSTQYYNTHAHYLPEIHVGSSVALQNPQTKLWDIYGTVTEIGPHRRYYVRTQSGRVLVRNRRFLRRRVPITTLPATSTDGPYQDEQMIVTPQQDSVPRRSSRTHKPTQRLIEDVNWP